jgi:hypothetical protein
MTMNRQVIGTAISQLRWEVDDGVAGEFNRWYDEEHLADVLSHSGVLSGRRFVRKVTPMSAPSPFNYLTLYQLESLDALQTPSYRSMAQSPSEWTRRVAFDIPRRQEIATQVFPANASKSGEEPIGRAIMHAMTCAEPSVLDDFQRWYDEEHLPMLLACKGILSARRFACAEPSEEGFEFIAIYQLEDADVPMTSEVMAAGQPTPWRKRLGDQMRAHFQVYEALAQVSPPA